MSASVAPVELSRRLTRVNIYSQADFGSTSHRNMERIGLRVLCTRSIWTR
jgi:hypothetical protein